MNKLSCKIYTEVFDEQSIFMYLHQILYNGASQTSAKSTRSKGAKALRRVRLVGCSTVMLTM